MSNLFERLDKSDLEIRKEKTKRKYRLHLYNSLYQNGYIAEMGDSTLTWLILGDKCTATAQLDGQVVSYLVYNGQWSGTIIDQLAEIRGKSRGAIERDLKRLKELNRIDYQRRTGAGTRIIVFPIPGTFERKFKAVKDLGQSDIKIISKWDKDYIKVGQRLSQSDIKSKSANKKSVKENKGNVESRQNRKVLDNDLYKDNSNNKELLAVASQIARVLNGTITKEKVLAEIQGREPEKMLGLAREVMERSGVQNPAGLWVTLVREEKAKGKEPNQTIVTGVYVFIPDEVLGIFKEKLQGKELENQLWQTLDKYHKKFNPREFHKFKEDLSESEIKNMVEVAKKVQKLSLN